MKLIINADGGSRGNPGPAAVGIAIWTEDRTVLEQHRECIGKATNNEAEYNSLIKALELAAKHKAEEVIVFMDSELVIRQMTGEYKVKSPHLLRLFERAKSAARPFRKVSFFSVSREDEHQAVADRLVNEALDSR